MESLKNLQDKIAKLCLAIYPKTEFSASAISFPASVEEVIKFSRRNRLDHYLALELLKEDVPDPNLKEKLKTLEVEYHRYKKTLNAAITLLNTIFESKRWMLVKTLSSYPHITTDIDVLVETPEIAEKAKLEIQKSGWPKTQNGESGGDLLDLDIDINHRISWTSSEEISPEFTWNHTEEIAVDGLRVNVPDPVLDTLIRVAHMPFEMGEVRLGELMHIFHQAENINWKLLEEEAGRRNWPHAFKNMFQLLAFLHQGLFAAPFKGLKVDQPKNSLPFPYKIPYTALASAVIEKRAWFKIWGARYVLKERLLGVKCMPLPTLKPGLNKD
ncbi:MAG: hypothetical protein ACE5EK_09355 [Nitrospinales bacterium]